MKNGKLFTILCILPLFSVALADSCTSPKVSVKSFSTQDATILTQLAHIGEFTVECGNKASPNLFVEFPCGKIVPAAKIGENAYQVSWTEDIKRGSSGDVTLRLLDEEGYSNIRKAQREGGNSSKVKSLANITVATKSAYKGPWVKAEIIAALLIGGLSYFAITTKSKVQA